MIIIIGLGNPGRRFKNTPHNLGFDVIDHLRKRYHFPRFNKQEKAMVSQGSIGDQAIILAKPLTFMNESGLAATELSEYYQVKPDQIWLIYDDADLPLGEIKIDFNRGSGGHKGVASVIDSLGTKGFYRLRLGSASTQRDNLKAFVLKPYSRYDRSRAKEMILEAIIELERSLLNKISA